MKKEYIAPVLSCYNLRHDVQICLSNSQVLDLDPNIDVDGSDKVRQFIYDMEFINDTEF